KTERDDGAAEVVVDGFRYSDEGNSLLEESVGNPKRPVTANDDQRIEAHVVEIANAGIRNVTLVQGAVFADGIGKRIAGISRTQDCAAKMKDAGNARRRHRPRATMHKSVEALFDTEDFPSVSDGCFDSGADDGV